MLATIQSATLLGVAGQPVTSRSTSATACPAISIVGLPDEACRESRDRVRAAIMSSGLAWPTRRITVNLAPASQRKGGVGLDLAIAVGVLVADRAARRRLCRRLASSASWASTGRSASGGRRRAAGRRARRPSPPSCPVAAAHEAESSALGDGARASPTSRAGRACCAVERLARLARRRPPTDDPPVARPRRRRGQPEARLALEIAAAGGHHLLLVGPPGRGKTMLAQRLPGCCRRSTQDAALEATMVHSAAGVRLPPGGLVRQPTVPRAAPHELDRSRWSAVAPHLRPGEISLAHGGVLFLDELGEFSPACSTRCASRWRRASSASPGPRQRDAARPVPARRGDQPVPVRRRPARARASATTARRPALPAPAVGPLARSVRSPRRRPAAGGRRAARRRGWGAIGRRRARVERARGSRSTGVGMLNARSPAHARPVRPADSPGRPPAARRAGAARLTGRGYHRVRRVARTLADLETTGPSWSRRSTSRSRWGCGYGCGGSLRTGARMTAVPEGAYAAAARRVPG